MNKQYSPEVIALRDRVVRGNLKLNLAWQQLRNIADRTEEWAEQLDRWSEANEKLSTLCYELKLKGYEDCLFLDGNGKKTKKCLMPGEDIGCRVCPSSKKWWEEELMELPSPGGK